MQDLNHCAALTSSSCVLTSSLKMSNAFLWTRLCPAKQTCKYGPVNPSAGTCGMITAHGPEAPGENLICTDFDNLLRKNDSAMCRGMRTCSNNSSIQCAGQTCGIVVPGISVAHAAAQMLSVCGGNSMMVGIAPQNAQAAIHVMHMLMNADSTCRRGGAEAQAREPVLPEHA